MNKTKIEWCNYTLNPYIGCMNNCSYCYARKMNDRFGFVKNWDIPEFKINWLIKLNSIKKPSVIFMGSMTDLFGVWVNDDNIETILKNCGNHLQHQFLFLTKNPTRYMDFVFPDNCWKGMTVENGYDLDIAKECNCNFVSIEPLQQQIVNDNYGKIDWVIIGGLTPKNNHHKIWVDDIINHCNKQFIPVFLKSNLHYPEKIQKYPKKINSVLVLHELKDMIKNII